MEKIYSKFVKERKREFQIETALWKDGDSRKVTKRNIYPEGAAHIEQICETYRMYEAQGILCGLQRVNQMISFSFVEGTTLEELLLEAVKSGKPDKIKEMIQLYHDALNKVCRQEEAAEISSEEAFGEVFGEPQESTIGYRNAIFDLTFDNIICQKDTYKIIDYEWRFPFAVERDLIQFRAVYAFLMKYSAFVMTHFTAGEFYGLFGIDETDSERYLEYNARFIQYVYGAEGYNSLLQKYKKRTLNVLAGANLDFMRKCSDIENGSTNEAYEEKTFAMLLGQIAEHKELYDDYHKFFRVTEKVRLLSKFGYLTSKEFYEEFSSYINGTYDMLEYYKTESAKKQEIVDEVAEMLESKSQENQALAEKYSCDYEILTKQIRQLEKDLQAKEQCIYGLQEKLQYIQSCKAYKMFLEKKVEEKYETNE